MPDLSEFRRQFPLTVAGLAHLANREAWLYRIWELDERLRNSMENGTHTGAGQEEVVVKGNPPANLSIEGEFEIIYAGGTLGLLHAAVMAARYGRKVLVFDTHNVGKSHCDWNTSDKELEELERAKLFTKDEIKGTVVNRYKSSFVKFHDANSRVKAPPLWMDDVLNVALDADKLLSLAANKIRKSASESALIDNLRFIRAYVGSEKVFVEVEDKSEQRKLFTARLFVDATETNPPLLRQLNNGRSMTRVCPTVGTIAKGFVHGPETDQVDFSIGEILVSTEDAKENRQLIWEGFAGSPQRDEYATYLFFYDSVHSLADKSLLNLFERYFESLPTYKKQSSHWRVVKPVFGFVPSSNHQGWANQKQTAEDRVMLIGDAAGFSSPLAFCGFGSRLRNLHRLTHLTELALAADMLDQAALSEINAYEPRIAQMSSLTDLMRPTPKSKPSAVNETMNAVMTALHGLDERVRRELFQDRMTFAAFKSLLHRTARVYPRIFERVREHLGFKGTFWWLANIAESFLNERRAKKSKPSDLVQHKDAAQEFEHYVKLYKNERA
jgi:lycopene cyclase CruA